MKRFKAILTKGLIVGSLAFGLLGCNSDSDDDAVIPEVVAKSNIQIIHAVYDAPTVNVFVDGALFGGLENVDYQGASPWIEVDSASYAVRVEANLPGDNADVISANVTLDGDMTYSVLAVGSAADGSIEPLIVANTKSDIGAGNVRLQVVHAASTAPTVDVYVTAPMADIEVEQPLATAAFKDFTGQVEVTAGDYQIRLTPAGTKTVVYDSGTVSLTAGSDLLVMATTNTGTGSSPVSLLASDGTNSFILWDVNSKANVRVVHAVSDAPAVDVIANNALTLFNGVAFPDITGYAAVDAGTYLIDVAVDSDNSIVAIDDAEIVVESGKFYTAFANSDLATIGLDLVVDMPRPIATAAKVRIFHASPDAGNVDIYVTADGDIANVDPAFAAVPFTTPMLAETGYVELAAGDYVVTVTGAGSKDAAIETGTLSLAVNKVYTAIAIDSANGPTLLTADDLAPAFTANKTFTVNLSGDQEVPMVMTDSSATATVQIDETLPSFSITLDASMVDGATAAHVHAGTIGMNGGVAYPLINQGDGTFTLAATDLTQASLAALESGQWYLNVHTPSNPGGEVRGQIVPATTAVVTFMLSGAQEVPPVVSDAMGYGYALFNTLNNGVTLNVVTTGVEDATMAHIHTGFAGVSGGVLVPLVQNADDVNQWSSGGELVLEDATAMLLLSGGHYVNIHTPANPGGELRGQITASNIEVYGVVATGAQEVPAVTTDAMATGSITLNTTTMEITGTMTMSGLMPSMGHIHVGAVGVNGGVAVPFVNAGNGVWTVNTTLNADSMALMQAGGLYTNFHTAANPGGEVRGQITLGF
ncbi:CHRD domain-containing protein [Paraglaciecola sp. 25GB23A]|uniref:CHRD domain-containing protein n=1 Tax=Paraglaciecola sp. 25GB23A TaxID=3156068 RepID=UPI0032AF5164